MYNIGICENDKKICAEIEDCIIRYLKDEGIQAETYVWFTGRGLCNYLKSGNSLDLLFLGMEQPNDSGMKVAEYIRNDLGDYNMQIVFFTEKEKYTKQVFKAHPLELIIKPVTEEQIISVLDFSFKVINRYKRKFEFQVGTDYYFIPYDDIMYFYSEKRKIRIITKDGEESFYGKLSDICKKLPKNFIVIHKSYIVNMDYIKRYAYEVLELVNGTILSISKANRKMVRKALLAK
jgi:Response regulator of the LytR/AlgR family